MASSLRDAYITATLRCAPPANKPTPAEMTRCQPFLLEELRLLRQVRVVVALGKIGWDAYLRARRAMGVGVPRPLPRFGHEATARDARRHHAPRQLSPEPAEHVHGQADAPDAAVRVRPRPQIVGP